MSAKDTFFSIKETLRAGGRLISLADPKVMGILNLSPDSFYAASRFHPGKPLVERAGEMLEQGATFLDLGAYSSRPGAVDISAEEEKNRLLPALRSIVREYPDAIISVDTFRAGVAEAAIAEGAHIINDISGGKLDPAMFATVARLQVPYILMHMPGTPQTMQQHADYNDVTLSVLDFFMGEISSLRQLGVHDIILDPGFGFGKTIAHNFTLLRRLATFRQTGFPVLAGLSRKSTIWKTLHTDPEHALNGTTALNMAALMNGASVLRVHDVREAVETVKLYVAFRGRS
ncbi:MAG: dihydropteroate synthase [Mucilaginibacter polytrichastri]|nr:dihydropteroate synthase [Mucilaginibacter polytrichastri]